MPSPDHSSSPDPIISPTEPDDVFDLSSSFDPIISPEPDDVFDHSSSSDPVISPNEHVFDPVQIQIDPEFLGEDSDMEELESSANEPEDDEDSDFVLTTDESLPISEPEIQRAVDTVRRSRRMRRGAQYATFDEKGEIKIKRYDLFCIRNSQLNNIPENESTDTELSLIHI